MGACSSRDEDDVIPDVKSREVHNARGAPLSSSWPSRRHHQPPASGGWSKELGEARSGSGSFHTAGGEAGVAGLTPAQQIAAPRPTVELPTFRADAASFMARALHDASASAAADGALGTGRRRTLLAAVFSHGTEDADDASHAKRAIAVAADPAVSDRQIVSAFHAVCGDKQLESLVCFFLNCTKSSEQNNNTSCGSSAVAADEETPGADLIHVPSRAAATPPAADQLLAVSDRAPGVMDETLDADAILRFGRAVGVEDDVCLLYVLFKLGARGIGAPWTLTFREYAAGVTLSALRSVADLQLAAKRWALEYAALPVQSEGFLSFYRFVFLFSKPSGARSISPDDAVTLWRSVLAPKWEGGECWIAFFTSARRLAVFQDAWAQVGLLAASTTWPGCPEIDAAGNDNAWPVLIDEFVDHVRHPPPPPPSAS